MVPLNMPTTSKDISKVFCQNPLLSISFWNMSLDNNMDTKNVPAEIKKKNY